MSDQPIREIQLGGKQLVFLFMASVVVAVAIFLLGVSVGRGVRGASAEAAGSTEVPVADAGPATPIDMPPATEMKPDDFRYHDQLQGGSSSSSGAATPPAAAQAPPAKEAAPVNPPAAKQAAEVVPPPVASPKAPAGTGWFLQTDAFRSRENADRRAAQLKAKGYAAMVDGGGAGALFRVRIGPFADREEASRTAERLRREEGLKPSIQR